MKNKLLFLLLTILFTNSYSQGKYINVTGTSKLILDADQINFTLQIKVIDESIEGSKRKNDEYVTRLLKILKESGIRTDDVDVSPITLGKNYDFTDRERKQNGFYTQVNISFLLKDLSKYYDLTDKLAANDNFEIINPYYNISDYEAQHKKAYEQALTAAKEKAGYMCSTLGLSLGDVLEIDETGNPQPSPNPFNTVNRENNQNENPFGKVTITRSVRIKFAIK